MLSQIKKLKENRIDHIIIENMPISDNLPETPTIIKNKSLNLKESILLQKIAKLLGKISDKEVENTIRFPLSDGKTNTETWHSHFQYKYSILYCLRGDKNAKTYIESANDIMTDTEESIKKSLLSTQAYVKEAPEFSLIKKTSKGYEFSRDIFDRSDFEEHIPDLDLPDAIKKLRKIHSSSLTNEAKKAVAYLLDKLENSKNNIAYKAGDVAIVSEQSTIRYSPGYRQSTEKGKERWLIATSIE